MTTRDIIDSTLESQPEGKELLNLIIINSSNTQGSYQNCNLLHSIIKLKFDVNRIHNEGYSLQEILDIGNNGIMYESVEKFVLEKLQQYINNKNTNK